MHYRDTCRSRVERTRVGAVFLVGSMRGRSAVNKTHRLYDAIITRFIFLSFLRLAAARPLLCPFGPIAPLHFVHLCSGHSKLLAFQCVMLPHALHRGSGQFASMWPYCWQRLHTSSLGRSLLLMRSVAARDEYADSFGRTFARGKAGRTACAAHSVWTP